jgi:adenylosuccinate synthase
LHTIVMHTIVVDLGYGDAGKGTVVDWLTSPAMGGEPVGAVVRFNGGAQAGHNVVTPDGRHHTFAQFGSGTLHGVPTHLSRFMLVEPLALAGEAKHLAALGVPDPLALLTIDRRALVTTPYHAAANRARETARGSARHGSCGVGIGETMAFALAHPDDALRVGDCAAPAALRRKLRRLQEHYLDQFGALHSLRTPTRGALAGAYRAFAERVWLVDETYLPALLGRRPVVFEGAQGVLLDEWRGFHPYTTWSTTTFDNAEALLAEAGQAGSAQRLGVTRPYLTRHGAGPFVTEDAALAAALPEPHNGTGTWQGPFRVGHLDLVALRYAVEVAGGAGRPRRPAARSRPAGCPAGDPGARGAGGGVEWDDLRHPRQRRWASAGHRVPRPGGDMRPDGAPADLRWAVRGDRHARRR